MAVNSGVRGCSLRTRFVYYSHKSLANCAIPPDWSFVVIIVNTSLHVQVFIVTLILFTVTEK